MKKKEPKIRMIYNSFNETFDNLSEFELFRHDLDDILSDSQPLILKGYRQRWYGNCNSYEIIDNTSDFLDIIGEYDDFQLYDINSHLYLKLYHRDGIDTYEIKELNDKGYNIYSNNYCGIDYNYELLEKLFNKYSKLVNWCYRLYGSPKQEYYTINIE